MAPRRSVTITAAWIGIIAAVILAVASIAVPFIEEMLRNSARQEIKYIGRVLDDTNQQPVAGAKVTLDFVGVPPVVYTDSEGVYRFDLSIASDVSGIVRVDAPGYQPYTRNIILSPKQQDIEDIRLTPQNTVPIQPSFDLQPGIWSIDYFSNTQLNAPIVYHMDQPAEPNDEGGYTVEFKSVDLHADPNIPQSNFSVRLSGLFEFQDGYYEFHCEHHDGCRVFVDSKIWVDAWWDGAGGHDRADNISAGTYPVNIEFYDKGGFGSLQVIWKLKVANTPALPPTGPTPSPDGSTLLADGPDHIDAFGVPMRLVPAGRFMMGSNADTALAECERFGIDCKREWFIREEPVHEVYLDAYYIDKYEVTNKFYKACVDAGVCSPPIQSRSFMRDDYYGNSEFDDYPVVFVNWNMAETYCEWRGAKLPTEAQWEKAARGTDERIFPWGDDIDYKYANFDQIIRDTTMVSQYEEGKSPYGVYDLAGNTVEWVHDWYSEMYYQNSPSSNPIGPDQGDGRVVRGGSWYDKDQIRSAWRDGWEPFTNRDGIGFRCAVNVNP
jgi:formylglycine-generating enzyme required for sulfatase activity